ncbi:MAG TPA: hypothetical protein PLL23_15000 [Chitinophagaceae bacterium]|nr:hypothetical protein [Chitinophagaceae bacterium]
MKNRKSRLFLLTVLAVLLLAAAFFGFSKQTFREQVEINYAILKTGEQLRSKDQVQRWYLSSSGESDSLSVSEQTPFSARITARFQGKEKAFRFSINGDTLNAQLSNVTLSYENTYFGHWFGKNPLIRDARKSLQNLKAYMEDSKRFYGYEIQLVKVEDTAFLFKSVSVPLATKREATRKLFDELIAYAASKDAGYNGVRIFYSLKGEKDIKLFASIGVTNAMDPDPATGIEYKKMPLGKNLLVANYQGTLNEVDKAYRALDRFKSDHNFTSMAIPFQKILSDGYDFSDEQIVQLKIFSPVF